MSDWLTVWLERISTGADNWDHEPTKEECLDQFVFECIVSWYEENEQEILFGSRDEGIDKMVSAWQDAKKAALA